MRQITRARHAMFRLREDPDLEAWTDEVLDLIDDFIAAKFAGAPDLGVEVSAFVASAGDVVFDGWKRRGRERAWEALDVDLWLDLWGESHGWLPEIRWTAAIVLDAFLVYLVERGDVRIEAVAGILSRLHEILNCAGWFKEPEPKRRRRPNRRRRGSRRALLH